MHKRPFLPACVTQLPLKIIRYWKHFAFHKLCWEITQKIKGEVRLCHLEKAEMLCKLDREINILVVECHYGINQSTSLMRKCIILMRYSLLWDDMQLRYMVRYRCFGIAYWSHLQRSSSPRKLLDFLTLAGGTDRLSRNVGKESPIYARQHPKRAKISYILW